MLWERFLPGIAATRKIHSSLGRFSASPLHEKVMNAEQGRLMAPAVVRFLGRGVVGPDT